MTYPIAELFTSVQGEGIWTGTPMYFIRLAGCNVGKYTYDPIHQRTVKERDLVLLRDLLDEPELVDHSHSVCTTWAGRRFPCDTDYHASTHAHTEELTTLFKQTNLEHVCITGGEPFLHDLTPLIEALTEAKATIHIETSGTLPITNEHVWITCSPKQGFDNNNRDVVDEWKFLVSSEEEVQAARDFLGDDLFTPAFLQPINPIRETDDRATAEALQWVLKYPRFALSAQLHKYLKVL